jgi:16S rRNA (uracil1498-N3)-methyltransferase
MRVPRIYTSQPLQENAAVALEPGASQHLARALRMQVGDALLLFDGRGGQYPATITAVDRKRVTVTTATHQPTEVESPLRVHLAIGMSRGDRMDWVVQKATELGISAVTPLVTERTELKLRGERAEKKRVHWQQVAISACEQCGRNHIPGIAAPASLADWLAQCDAELRLVLHHRADPAPVAATPASVALLVGPEGGLSTDEIAAAEAAGFASLRLGPRVLRTETAPLAALAIIQSRCGDMAPA